jgi:hypothetical protein
MKFVAGALYVGSTAAVRRLNPRTGWLATVSASMGHYQGGTNGAVTGACGVTVDAAGNVLVADYDRVLVVAKRTGRFYGRQMIAGRTYTIAGQRGKTRDADHDGNNGPATRAFLSDAVDVELDHAGNVVIADAGQPPYHLEQDLGAMVRVVAERDGRFYGRQMIAGNIYTVAGASGGTTRNGALATQDYLGMTIGPVRVDRAGNLVLTDYSSGPVVQVVAVRTGRFYGLKMTAGHIYTLAGDGTAGYSGDGGPATKAALITAAAVALDHAGNVVIADGGRVRVVAVRTGSFYHQKMTADHIYSIAGTGPIDGLPGISAFPASSGDGGPAARAHIQVSGVTVDSAGNVVLADSYRVRVVAARTGSFYGRKMRAGDIYTIAGNGQAYYSGDGLLAARAELQSGDLAVDHAGDLVVNSRYAQADRIRLIPAASGTLFGRRMTKGHIYAVAGDGHGGIRGDDGPALRADLNPDGMAADRSGNLLIADLDNRVRVVAARSGRFYGQQMTTGDIYTIAGDGTAAYSGDGGPACQGEPGLSHGGGDRSRRERAGG